MKLKLLPILIVILSMFTECRSTKHRSIDRLRSSYDTMPGRYPDTSILMDVSKGRSLLEDCSGSRLMETVDSFWSPVEKDYAELQSNFVKLNNQIKSLQNYTLQYVGVVIEQSKYIYINAFDKVVLKNRPERLINLRSAPLVICGGGLGFWRVLYNVDLKEFEKVRSNAPK